MTVELREKVDALKNHIEKRDYAARETAHRIAEAQAGFAETREKSSKNKELVSPKELSSHSHNSADHFVSVVEKQINLIEEVSAITKMAEQRVVEAERKTLAAYRQAFIANIIAVISVILALVLFFNSGS